MQAYKVSHNGLKSFLKSHFLISKFSYIFKTNVFPKGQKQLKMIFSGRRFLQKMNERVLLYYYETSDWLVFVHLWRKLKTPKGHFEINWTLKLHTYVLMNIRYKRTYIWGQIDPFYSKLLCRWDQMKSWYQHILGL